MKLVFYQYPKCSTCKKAKRWLDEQGLEYRSVDLVQAPPSKGQLKKILKKSNEPIRKLFNTSGVSYRLGDFKTRLSAMTDEDAFDALAADGKLIKRPLLVGDDFARIGFKESEWAESAT